MGQRCDPGIRLEVLTREADGLTRPRLGGLRSPLLGVNDGKQAETDNVPVGDVRRVGPLDGLLGDAPRLLEIAGEIQGVREAGQDADAKDIRARTSGRYGAMPVLDRRTDIAALDYLRPRNLDRRLDIRRP